ncbi:hypothetical protein BV210_08910 [Halorientalis sp. IM1011]|uniref:DUF7536 family protein n=1 Tax=Halorientalis sp. IM1011 TaxID=1932360 RepID=UPI00097CD313|nr:hypothetical protein [Halorientalis sp. IM1011]AQL42823.1 hypothetical protein BV210_08910 [Halorientalis sp. IM1011]
MTDDEAGASPGGGVEVGASAGSDDRPERPGGKAALVEALHVRAKARRGLVIGLVVTVAIFGFFVVIPGVDRSPLYYAALAFVLFLTTWMLAVATLVGRRALHLTATPAGIVRWSARGGVLAGVLWLLAAADLALGGSPTGLTGVLLSTAPLIALFGVWAVHTRYKRATRVRPLATAGAWLAIPGALGLAVTVLAPDIGTGPLVLLPASLLVVAQGLQAVTAVLADARWQVPVLLGGGSAAGLGVAALTLPATTGHVALAVGFGLPWLLIGVWFRGVREEDVPATSESDLATL